MTLRSLLSASALISIGLLVGRLIGLVREMLLAAQFGTGSEANMAIAILIIPDFITAALIGSALSAVLVPAFANRPEQRMFALFWQTLWSSVIIFTLIAFFSGILLLETTYADALILTLCALPLVAANAVITTYLQHRGHFLIPAFANAIFNSVILATLLFASSDLIILAYGIIAAAFIRLNAHIWAFLRAGGRYVSATSHPLELKKPLLIAYMQTSGASILSILPQYIPYIVIASLSVSGFAIFNYAFKLLVFPAILVQTIIQLALLPWFVRQRTESPDDPKKQYSLSLQLGWSISLAVALAVSLCSHAIADLCFGHGKMTPDDVSAVGELLAIGIWVTPGAVLLSIWQQMLYAHEKPKPVLYSSIMLVSLLIPFCIAGNLLAGEAGALIGFVIAQTLPVFLLAKIGGKHIGISSLPSGVYIKITLLTLIMFFPLATLYQSLNLDSFAGVALGITIGMLSMFSGFFACKDVREKLYEYAKNNHHN